VVKLWHVEVGDVELSRSTPSHDRDHAATSLGSEVRKKFFSNSSFTKHLQRHPYKSHITRHPLPQRMPPSYPTRIVRALTSFTACISCSSPTRKTRRSASTRSKRSWMAKSARARIQRGSRLMTSTRGIGLRLRRDMDCF
jgi:hypothetical protein